VTGDPLGAPPPDPRRSSRSAFAMAAIGLAVALAPTLVLGGRRTATTGAARLASA
jgi:hypothetical protein